MSQLFTWGGQNNGVSASASVLPMNTQDWSPLGWTGWIFLQSKSKGLSRVFSNTTVQKHQFFSAQLSSQSNAHIHTWPQEGTSYSISLFQQQLCIGFIVSIYCIWIYIFAQPIFSSLNVVPFCSNLSLTLAIHRVKSLQQKWRESKEYGSCLSSPNNRLRKTLSKWILTTTEKTQILGLRV